MELISQTSNSINWNSIDEFDKQLSKIYSDIKTCNFVPNALESDQKRLSEMAKEFINLESKIRITLSQLKEKIKIIKKDDQNTFQHICKSLEKIVALTFHVESLFIKTTDPSINNIILTDENEPPSCSRIKKAGIDLQLFMTGLNIPSNSYILGDGDFQRIEKYILNLNNTLNQTTFFSKVGTKLPLSLVYIHEGQKKGWYMLFKTSYRQEEIGLGAFNRITLAINFETGKKFAFRSAMTKNIGYYERKINKQLSESENFVGGPFVNYEGSWRTRKRSLNCNKLRFPKSIMVNKTGFILEYFEAGDLYNFLKTHPSHTLKDRGVLAYKVADALADLHNVHKLVHLDIKSTNIMIRGDKVKIADFSTTIKIGYPKSGGCTPGYSAPELISDSYFPKSSDASTEIDVWSLGVVFLEILGVGCDWRTPSMENNESFCTKPENIEILKEKVFKKLSTTYHENFSELCAFYFYVIEKCLQFDPAKRITATDASTDLKGIFK